MNKPTMSFNCTTTHDKHEKPTSCSGQWTPAYPSLSRLPRPTLIWHGILSRPGAPGSGPEAVGGESAGMRDGRQKKEEVVRSFFFLLFCPKGRIKLAVLWLASALQPGKHQDAYLEKTVEGLAASITKETVVYHRLFLVKLISSTFSPTCSAALYMNLKVPIQCQQFFSVLLFTILPCRDAGWKYLNEYMKDKFLEIYWSWWPSMHF